MHPTLTIPVKQVLLSPAPFAEEETGPREVKWVAKDTQLGSGRARIWMSTSWFQRPYDFPVFQPLRYMPFYPNIMAQNTQNVEASIPARGWRFPAFDLTQGLSCLWVPLGFLKIIEIKFIHNKSHTLKWNSVVFNSVAKLCNHHLSSSRTVFHPRSNTVPIRNPSISLHYPIPGQPLMCFSSPWIYLFWVVHMSLHHIPFVVVCFWLLSLHIMLSRFIPCCRWIRASFVSTAE